LLRQGEPDLHLVVLDREGDLEAAHVPLAHVAEQERERHLRLHRLRLVPAHEQTLLPGLVWQQQDRLQCAAEQDPQRRGRRGHHHADHHD